MSSYDHFAHRHNFAVWAAARAAQRGFTTVARLKAALEACGIVEFLRQPNAQHTGREEFDHLHREWCVEVVDHLTRQGISNPTYGRAAKLIAVYLKAMVVVGPLSDSSLAQVAHPPVDRILLRNLARTDDISSPHKREWARLNWTQLGEDAYCRLISQLRECLNDGEPMWHLEKYWTVTAL